MIFISLREDHLQNFGRTKEEELCKINVFTHCLVPEFFQLLKETKLKQHWVYSTSHVCMILFMVTLLVTLSRDGLLKKYRLMRFFKICHVVKKDFSMSALLKSMMKKRYCKI